MPTNLNLKKKITIFQWYQDFSSHTKPSNCNQPDSVCADLAALSQSALNSNALYLAKFGVHAGPDVE